MICLQGGSFPKEGHVDLISTVMDSEEQYVITDLVLLVLKQLGYNNIITMTLVCKFKKQ